MTTLDPRTIANRENARKSTGPRTEEGKTRSRLNAFQHGLAGKGTAWPDEDQAELDAFVAKQVELERPQDEREAWLASRAAVLAWQIDRGDRIEAFRAGQSSQRAVSDEQTRRESEVDRLVQELDEAPDRSMRALLRTAEGCEWIANALRERLRAVDADAWNSSLNPRLQILCGPNPTGLLRPLRAQALGLALSGESTDAVWPSGIPGLEPRPSQPSAEEATARQGRLEAALEAARPKWREELRAILRARLDEVERRLADGQPAADLALELTAIAAGFDDSREGERFRRYRRAILRERQQVLAELAEWRAGRSSRPAPVEQPGPSSPPVPLPVAAPESARSDREAAAPPLTPAPAPARALSQTGPIGRFWG